MGPTWGPPGSCRPQMGPMLAPWTLLSGLVSYANPKNVQSLQWCNMKHHGISDHWPLDYLFNRLFRLTSKKHQGSALLTLCDGNPPVTGGFPSQRTNNSESVSMALCQHHDMCISSVFPSCPALIWPSEEPVRLSGLVCKHSKPSTYNYTDIQPPRVDRGYRDWYTVTVSGLIQGMRSANERRCYMVTSPLISWAHTQNELRVWSL